MYEYHVQICFDPKIYRNCFHIIFFKIYVLIYSLNVFQQLAKEALVLYEFTISELNITIKIVPGAAEPLPLFADYIES
jgi:hypothetical protein